MTAGDQAYNRHSAVAAKSQLDSLTDAETTASRRNLARYGDAERCVDYIILSSDNENCKAVLPAASCGL